MSGTVSLEDAAAGRTIIQVGDDVLVRFTWHPVSVWAALYEWLARVYGFNDPHRMFNRVHVGAQLHKRLLAAESERVRALTGMKGMNLRRQVAKNNLNYGPLTVCEGRRRLVGDGLYVVE